MVCCVLVIALCKTVAAEEGMWIPMLIEQLNIKQMQDIGLKLSAEDIYSVNRSSLKDAIVQFGGGCTAEIISPEGLILTNHHCGYGAIQRQSSLEHDYLTNGFWATSHDEELPCPGLTVTLLIRMEEVTEKALQGVTGSMNQMQRGQLVKQNIEKIEKEATAGTGYEAKVRPFYYGNQYYLFVNEVFRDVRLVGAPPSSIGKFGGDTDNWMWPRHTGDFSLFRIYTDKDNKGAAYSKDNVPYRPKYFLPVSLKGYQKKDFTFVFGYPGTTREYLTSYAIDLTTNIENPLRIDLRKKKLDIINAAMESDQLVKIQYSAKAAGIANFWKKMIGESRGIKRLNGLAKKQAFEQKFQCWTDSLSLTMQRYGGLLRSFEATYREYRATDIASIYLTEAGQGIELVRFAAGFRELVKYSKAKPIKPDLVASSIKSLQRTTREFFRNYSAAVDKQLMSAMLGAMLTGMDPKSTPDIFAFIAKKYAGNADTYAAYVFGHTLLADSSTVLVFLADYKPSMVKNLEKDPAFNLAVSIYQCNENNVLPKAMVFNAVTDSLQRTYMQGQMEMQRDKRFYPDANSTLRIAYGQVNDYCPADAVTYNFFTTLGGVIQKEDPAIYDYTVDPKLKFLYLNRDFGPYCDRDSTMHVAFTASNHTTGGNSGSPVLNAEGQLIGINFDRNWEGTMSDMMYDPSQCRNIALDIRYCLFIIDKMAGAKWLIAEMNIVR